MSSTVSVPAPPTTAEASLSVLAEMGAQSGVITDYNTGSQIRTLSEAFGSVIEEQGIINQALVFQAIVYSAYKAFGISPLPASQAAGVVTFSTSNGVAASYGVAIQAGFIVQSSSGTQYATTQTVVLAQGAMSVSVPVLAVNAGRAGNASAGAVTVLASQAPYPLLVSNAAAITGGADLESAQATLARFTATVAALGEASPVSIANAVIGVAAPNTTEIVKYATVYEPWVAQVQNSQTPTAGFTVYVDNGSGSASAGLLAAVTALLNGSMAQAMSGFRPAGVPFSVQAVSGVTVSVYVAATLINTNNSATLTSLCSDALQGYFSSLQFGQAVQTSQVIASVAGILDGYITSLTVTVKDSSGTTQPTVAAAASQRILLGSATLVIQ